MWEDYWGERLFKYLIFGFTKLYMTHLQVSILCEFPNRPNRGLNELRPRTMDWSQSTQAQRDAFIWFTESQLRLVIRNGVVPEWFHGIISRNAEDRCRHFMIDALEDGQYIIVGEDRRHRVLQDLVDFHRRNPIMPFSEVLTVACGQASGGKTDYAELLFPQRHLNPNTSWLPNVPLHPSISHPPSQEDIPPALPYRPNNLRNSALPSPNRLYPSLEEEFPHVTIPLPATPVPKPRHLAINLPSNQPPEVPARTSLPPLKQNQACIRTVSAPESATTPSPSPSPTTTEHPLSANLQPAKNQECKLSVVSNLKNFKKKFQKKNNTPQEATENEYHEISEEHTFSAPPFTYTCAVIEGGGLPQEYLPPPPFAPGH
ncbi:hypothetical protein ABVT39_010976 [Epinephelus coioides]